MPAFIIAEMSANHLQDMDQALRLIEVAFESGADAVKIQTYTPDTMTIDCDSDFFKIHGTLWKGKNLYQLYKEAQTPWGWHEKLKKRASDIGVTLFSSPFDVTAVDFLEKIDFVAYKIASFEIVDIPLIKKIASTGKPVIMSTGMATISEIEEAVKTLRINGCRELALLKCTSAYPAAVDNINLATIPHLSDTFGVPAGLSDHTLGISVPIAAVSIGACIVEKHLTLSRSIKGPDSVFSLEPHEFKKMVQAVREAEKALGVISYEVTEKEKESRVLRRSIFVVDDMEKGAIFSRENVRSIRPGHGLHTRYFDDVLGKRAVCKIDRGTPLSWDLIGEKL